MAPPLGCNCDEPWGRGPSSGNRELALVLPEKAGGNDVEIPLSTKTNFIPSAFESFCVTPVFSLGTMMGACMFEMWACEGVRRGVTGGGERMLEEGWFDLRRLAGCV